ncbi:sigma-70 family RNA polymerase sigma factor [Reyranella sp.]|uniref:sigma-70 family RNA polymerase sigma factor n=1 Tax=Reyranella sp. TaxID=1929291 RepID=UPI002F946CF6
MQGPAEAFDPLRPTLIRIAYRMLGSVADAEDIVQETFLRWMATDRTTVRQPEAFLRQIVTRLCINHLKSARRRRDMYIGPWLPEPMVEAPAEDIDDITLPLMMALDRLSPLERAAFLLHDVFGVSFEEIGEIIKREPAACRQLATRARLHVRQSRPRFRVDKDRALELAQAFFTASRRGDLAALRAMLADDVSIYVDGGGRRRAPSQPVHGAIHVIKLHKGLAMHYAEHGSTLMQVGFVNGLPGLVTKEGDGELQSTALAIEDAKIAAIYVVRNPEKLLHLQGSALGGTARAV